MKPDDFCYYSDMENYGMEWIFFISISVMLMIVSLFMVYKYLKPRYKRFTKALSYIQECDKKLASLSYKTDRIEEILRGVSFDKNIVTKALPRELDNIPSAICHAMGKVQGDIFTNSEDAFLENYKKGYRIFEVDISLTKDLIPVLVHDWYQYNGGNFICDWKKVHREGDVNIPSYLEFQQIKICGKYKGLSLCELLNLAKKYSDAFFIVSVKTDRYEYDSYANYIFTALDSMIHDIDTALFHRIIPQVHGVKYMDAVRKNFHFDALIYGTRSCNDFGSGNIELLNLLSDSGIFAISCEMNTITKEVCSLYHHNNIKILAYIIKNKRQEEEMRLAGVDFTIGDYEL
jgi:glycerophosphoryl diester phosphodiesterase